MRQRLHLAAAMGGLLLAVAAEAQGRTELHFAAGVPVIRVDLRAGDRSYPCHLLLDLSRAMPLLLHRNAASVLRSDRIDVHSGDLVLRDLPMVAERDEWLERFTAAHPQELREVPLAGRLGLPAFAGALVLDGPGGTLEVLSAAQANLRPPSDALRAVVDLAAAPQKEGVQVPVELSGDVRGRLFLHPADPASYLEPDAAGRAGWNEGRVEAVVGALDLGGQVAFRPERPPGGHLGSIGGRLLARLRTTVHLGEGWIALELPAAAAPFPRDEGRFYAARYGDEPVAALQAYLADAGESPFREEAAATLLDLVLESDPLAVDPALLESACLQRIAATPPESRATQALAVLGALPWGERWLPLRHRVATTALEAGERDTDGNAVHKLRVELGRIAHARGELKEARRNLLSAVFGMPIDGPANLALGRLYEDQGQLERARGRYFLALLDMEHTGAQGLQALERVHDLAKGPRPLIEVLTEMADGRVPALHPIPREPEEIHPNGRVVLVELFTGAQCDPCAAADVAFDALGEYFGTGEIARIQWHLPVPAAEPLVSGAALDRARQIGAGSTPTCLLGGESVVGGGRAEQAPEMFARYRDLVEQALKRPPEATITGSATRSDGAVEVQAALRSERTDLLLHAVLVEDTVLFPGRNGILFHHQVARARVTPRSGVPQDQCRDDAPWTGRVELDEVAEALDQLVEAMEIEERFRVRPTTPDPTRLQVVLFAIDRDGLPVQAATVPVRSTGSGR